MIETDEMSHQSKCLPHIYNIYNRASCKVVHHPPRSVTSQCIKVVKFHTEASVCTTCSKPSSCEVYSQLKVLYQFQISSENNMDGWEQLGGEFCGMF